MNHDGYWGWGGGGKRENGCTGGLRYESALVLGLLSLFLAFDGLSDGDLGGRARGTRRRRTNQSGNSRRGCDGSGPELILFVTSDTTWERHLETDNNPGTFNRDEAGHIPECPGQAGEIRAGKPLLGDVDDYFLSVGFLCLTAERSCSVKSGFSSNVFDVFRAGATFTK